MSNPQYQGAAYPQQYPPQQQQQYPPNQYSNNQYPPGQYPPQQQQPQYVAPNPPAYYPPSQESYQAPTQNNAYPQNYNETVPKDPFMHEDFGLLSTAGFDERKGFVVKVYTLLSAQLFFTFGLVILAGVNTNFRDFLVDRNGGSFSVFTWVCFAISFIVEIAIFCCKGVAKKVPQNYIALSAFTVTFGVVVAAICGLCYNAFSNGAALVMISAGLTFAVTSALTAYACTTKTDITMKGGALWIIAVVLLVTSIISIFYFSIILQLMICALVVVCYGFYLVYDTQIIMGGKAHELSIDDYVIGTMLIYIDIIILFLRILQILMILFGKK